MNEPSTTPPTFETVEAEQVLSLPGYLFFVESVELPPALEPNEIADFAELTVESIAPFPIEQLNWGFLHSPGSTHLLIYATHRDRLKKHGVENLDSYAWVLPDFASFQGAHFPENTELTVLSENHITLLLFEAGSEAPNAIASQPRSGLNESDLIHSLREELDGLTNFPRKLAVTPQEAKISDHGLPTFSHTEEGTNNGVGYGNWDTLTPSEKELWDADIRSGLFKETERRSRRTSSLISKINGWALLAALFLVALEIFLIAGKAWLGTKTATVEEQMPIVTRIEEKQTLMNKLNQVAQNELRPVAILEALNTTRPDGIYFTSTETEGENRITIDGISTTINDLNRYADSLASSGMFELVGTPKTLTRGGKTTFTATLDYTHAETSRPQEAPEVQTSAPAEDTPAVDTITETKAEPVLEKSGPTSEVIPGT